MWFPPERLTMTESRDHSYAKKPIFGVTRLGSYSPVPSPTLPSTPTTSECRIAAGWPISEVG